MIVMVLSGAMLTHGNLLANLQQSTQALDTVRPSDVMFGILPLFHIFGLNVMLGTALLQGATTVLVQRFDPSTALDTLAERGVTVIPGAPPLWLAFSHFDEAPADAFANVRMALTGAAKMPEEAMRRLHTKFGLTLLEGYGLTEAAPVVTSSAGLEQRVGSVGKVLDGVQDLRNAGISNGRPAALVLLYLDDLSHRDIGEVLGISARQADELAREVQCLGGAASVAEPVDGSPGEHTLRDGVCGPRQGRPHRVEVRHHRLVLANSLFEVHAHVSRRVPQRA